MLGSESALLARARIGPVLAPLNGSLLCLVIFSCLGGIVTRLLRRLRLVLLLAG
jgi:hypothetical protein